MTPSARLSAAIEVLADIEARRRPAPDALKDWGLSHRFAGSKDRAAIAGLVYDSLRRKASAAWISADATPRGVLIGMLRLVRHLDAEAIAALFGGDRFAPAPLSATERARLAAASLDDAPNPVRGDFPAWIGPALARAFGGDAVAEMQALARRAPLDIRVNLFKLDQAAAKAALAHLDTADTPLSPWGLRLAVGEDGRGPSLQAEPGFALGHFEVQDEGSQVVTLLAGARPGETVVDLCAGAGGKALALAAVMANAGRIVATDVDGRRLMPIHDRLARAGVRNVEVRTPKGRWRPDGPDPLENLAGAADLVLVDAPCSGTGTWRRNPDAKWRLRPGSVAERRKDQATVLARAARLVKPGGRLVYVTCSVLPEENDDAVAAFRSVEPGFAPLPPAEVTAGKGAAIADLGRFATMGGGLLLSPRRTETDAFYASFLRKQ
jgi:16S rRNA (cytosine967-C5)-methyltransferase